MVEGLYKTLLGRKFGHCREPEPEFGTGGRIVNVGLTNEQKSMSLNSDFGTL